MYSNPKKQFFFFGNQENVFYWLVWYHRDEIFQVDDWYTTMQFTEKAKFEVKIGYSLNILG